LVGQHERKRKMGRLRRGWELNFKMDHKAMGYDDGEWIHLLIIWVSGELMETQK
jgi:hypothetical protein